MKAIEIADLRDNFFSAIGKEWMLVCAGGAGGFNMMTASWGGVGWLWNKAVAFVFIRPERHTFGFAEANEWATLSFLGDGAQARAAYKVCGSLSGRDVDKVALTHLKPVSLAEGRCVGFDQARLTLVCRKLYASPLEAGAFVDAALLERWYGKAGALHKMYVFEIVQAYVK